MVGVGSGVAVAEGIRVLVGVGVAACGWLPPQATRARLRANEPSSSIARGRCMLMITSIKAQVGLACHQSLVGMAALR
jgi:hypothetical protein